MLTWTGCWKKTNVTKISLKDKFIKNRIWTGLRVKVLLLPGNFNNRQQSVVIWKYAAGHILRTSKKKLTSQSGFGLQLKWIKSTWKIYIDFTLMSVSPFSVAVESTLHGTNVDKDDKSNNIKVTKAK